MSPTFNQPSMMELQPSANVQPSTNSAAPTAAPVAMTALAAFNLLPSASFVPPAKPSTCREPVLERTRFYPRQILGVEEMTLNQDYERNKRRIHNRMMHGWGVVCGCNVRYTSPWHFVLERGYVLGPMGDDICIPDQISIDIRRQGLDGNTIGPCEQQGDPWCSEVEVSRAADKTVYLAIRYAECPARPVRANSSGCGCEEGACEYSRIRDSFTLKVLPQLPASHTGLHPAPSLAILFNPPHPSPPRPCPACPTDGWVVLADLTPHDDGQIDIAFGNRRQCLSFADFYFVI